jgi:hypothetical protein
VEIFSKSSFLKAGIVSSTTCCDFSDFVKAMADETRQRILSLLNTGELNESDIVAHLELTQPTISHHLAFCGMPIWCRRDARGDSFFTAPTRPA